MGRQGDHRKRIAERQTFWILGMFCANKLENQTQLCLKESYESRITTAISLVSLYLSSEELSVRQLGLGKGYATEIGLKVKDHAEHCRKAALSRTRRFREREDSVKHSCT